MKNLLIKKIILGLIFLFLLTNKSIAKERIISEAQNLYYVNGSIKIKLCKEFGRKAEEKAIIKNIQNYKVITIPFDDEGAIINNTYIINNNKLIFSFDSIAQQSFFYNSFLQFEKFLKQKGVKNPNYMPGNFCSISGLNIKKDTTQVYIAYFYRRSRSDKNYLCLIYLGSVYLKNNNPKIKNVYQIDGETTNTIQYIKKYLEE